MRVVLTHIGADFPPYIKYCIEQLRHFNPDIHIDLIANRSLMSDLDILRMDAWGVYVVDANKFNDHPLVLAHEALSPHNNGESPNTVYPSPPNWLHNTMSRLFYLSAHMSDQNIKDVAHLENDVMVYFDINGLKETFKRLYKNFACIKMSDRHVSCAFCYIPDQYAIKKVCVHLLDELNKGTEQLLKERPEIKTVQEMTLLSYCDYIDLLPSRAASQGIFQTGIFDPASYGQYLGGTNSRDKGPGFIDEEHYGGRLAKEGKWVPTFEGGIPSLYSPEQDIHLKLQTLHIHSKQLQDFRTYAEV
jgi:hypothetical protein